MISRPQEVVTKFAERLNPLGLVVREVMPCVLYCYMREDSMILSKSDSPTNIEVLRCLTHHFLIVMCILSPHSSQVTCN